MQSVTHFGTEQQEKPSLQLQTLKMNVNSVDLRYEVITEVTRKSGKLIPYHRGKKEP